MSDNVSRRSSGWQIKAGAIMSYVIIAVNIVASLVYTPWMISVIGESTYGIYTLATSLISLFMMDFGISAATAKFIARYRAEGNVEKINKFLGMVYKLYLIIDVIIAAVFVVIYFNVDAIYPTLAAGEATVFKKILVIIIFYNLIAFPFSTLTGILNAYENFFVMKLAGCLNKILTVAATFVALALGGGIFALVFIHVGFNLLTVLFRLIMVKKNTPVRADMTSWDKKELGQIFTFSMWATVVSIMSRLVFNITPSILAMFVGAAEITIFGLASTLEGYVFTFSEGINGLFLSKTTRASLSENRDAELLKLMTRVGRINLSVVALIIVGFAVAGQEFVLLWLGEGFENVYYCGILMIAPNLIYFPQQIGRTMLVVEDKQRYQAIIYIIMGVFNVGCAFALVPFMGVLGSAISIAITYCLRFILMSVVFHRVLKIDMKSFYINCYLKMLLPIILTGAVGFVIFRFFVIHSWLVLLVKCCVLPLVYFGLMWLLGWNKDEKGIITGFFGSLGKKIRGRKKDKGSDGEI
ncbi:MAG: oligosaccharide flippase family protein [Clostridia bacterium]|nr:oligosaccharide flippase family protein [Clostridia bacterium]